MARLLYFSRVAVVTPLKIRGAILEHGNSEPARERSIVSRNQNVMYVLPHDSAAIEQFMGPVLEQLAALDVADEPSRGPRAVVVTPDAESAVAVARWVASRASDAPRAIAATGAARTARLIAAQPAPLVVGPPDQLLELVRRAALKLDDVRAVVIAWADGLVDAGAVPSLEALMGEMPKESARTVVAARSTPEVEALVEQYARRPRRVGSAPADAVEPLAVRFVITSAATRSIALRHLLDALDPPGAAIYVRSDDSERDVRDMVRTLGYAGDAIVRVVRQATPSAALVILYDLPPSRSELDALAASAPNQVVALVQPKQLTALAALAGAARLSPFSLDASLAAARASDQRTRDELRSILERGLPTRELLTLEPLLGDFDAASLAAAALHLLEAERGRRVPNATPAAPNAMTAAAAGPASDAAARAPRRPAPGGQVRLFVNVGEKDGVSPRDLVGAIANEAGIAGSRIGRVEIRENHSLVELDAADAERAVQALGGANIRGRRVSARVDRDRPPRERAAHGDRGGPTRGKFPRRPGTRDRGPSRRRDE